MILRSLTLQNFRSYGEPATRLELDEGLLLFEGEIGSGKSTLLYAIEFALFGLGDLEAKHVLRSSATAARVEVEFEVSGSEYTVTRTLEKKKTSKATLFQTKGWLKEPDGSKSELSSGELKTRILQILNFREKPGRASSRIYRYAIFTPQELMKEVLALKPEDRLDTLRRAFGIEDYSFAASSADIVDSRLEERSELHSELSKQLPEKGKELSERQRALSRDQEALVSEEKKLSTLESNIRQLKDDLESLGLQTEQITKLRALIPRLEQDVEDARSELESMRLLLKKYDTSKLSELKSEAVRLGGKAQALTDIQTGIEEARSQIGALSTNIEGKEMEIAEMRNKVESVGSLGGFTNCPLCGQKLDVQHVKNISHEYNAKIGLTKSAIENLKTSLKSAEETKKSLELNRNTALLAQKQLETVNREVAQQEELNSRMKGTIESISKAESKLASKMRELASKKQELEENEPLLLKVAKLKEERDELQKEYDETREAVGGLKKGISDGTGLIQSLSKEIEKMQKSSAKASYYRAVSTWVGEYFVPAVTDIERHVLASVNEEFDSVFSRIFSLLVEEVDIAVNVDDQFTPLIEESGYELDTQSLSGGERTAVALAYRLALNFMVKRANEAMNADLLILDEPTEGFSKEQIYKLKTALDELKCNQIIVVSHEPDLESMADRIYRVEKVNGKSIVSAA
jgi:DNA repair protein SbcC/Rad50